MKRDGILFGDGGCNAKLGGDLLEQIIPGAPFRDPRVVCGMEFSEDAGVFDLGDKLIVQSTDFFPPMIDDAYLFGQVAACNALSDIYVMGAKPITALNIVAFPHPKHPLSLLKAILQGGQDILNRAHTSLLGGHTINDTSIKYGLAVTGEATKNQITSNGGGEAGDLLLLTKPLGIGIALNAAKGDDPIWRPEATIAEAINWMTTLNDHVLSAILKFNIKCATDITGFSLMGHALEVAQASNVDIRLYKDALPAITGVTRLAQVGFYPAASHYNKKRYQHALKTETPNAPELDLIFDAQTSGGALLAVKPEIVHNVIDFLSTAYNYPVALIGTMVPKTDKAAVIEVI